MVSFLQNSLTTWPCLSFLPERLAKVSWVRDCGICYCLQYLLNTSSTNLCVRPKNRDWGWWCGWGCRACNTEKPIRRFAWVSRGSVAVCINTPSVTFTLTLFHHTLFLSLPKLLFHTVYVLLSFPKLVPGAFDAPPPFQSVQTKVRWVRDRGICYQLLYSQNRARIEPCVRSGKTRYINTCG